MPFPTTSILDDFNRADNTSSLGASWSSPIESGFSSFGILSNQAYPAGGFRDNYWNTSYAADQEVFVTVAAINDITGFTRIFARLNTPGGSVYNGYALELNANVPSAYLTKFVAGAQTDISGGTSSSLVAGDSFCLVCSGTNISHWRKPAAGSWTLVNTVVDSSITSGGFLGLHTRDETLVRFNDFGGGSIVTGGGGPGTSNRIMTLGVG